MIKQLIGWLLYIISMPLILSGGALFVIYLAIYSIGAGDGKIVYFTYAIVMVLLGFLARTIGERLRRIRY
jgi:drug/metabolite transporter (DMT)-like permease